jgi:outer membrane protein OmpA-like peptidoglycan-associated protein
MRKSIRLAVCLIVPALSQTVFAQPNENFGNPVSTTVYVSFPSSSVSFRPGPDDAAMLASAKDAALVAIRGRTSTTIPTAKDEALALARATSARAYLVARGVSPLKITINYASAADFVTDNFTPEGRLQNQRVEIDIIHVPAF